MINFDYHYSDKFLRLEAMDPRAERGFSTNFIYGEDKVSTFLVAKRFHWIANLRAKNAKQTLTSVNAKKVMRVAGQAFASAAQSSSRMMRMAAFA